MIKNIQALRGVAALLVLFNHMALAQVALDPRLPVPAWLSSPAGAMGVDIFFVISGYVITLVATRREHRAAGFFMARIARVTPLYLALSLAMILVRVPEHHAWSWRSVWNGLFYLPLFDFGYLTAPPIGVGWTLSFEMWFYTVFALVMAILPARRTAQMLPFLFCAGAILMSFYRGSWFFPHFMFHPFVVEFALGCLVFNYQEHLTRGLALALFAVGFGLLLFFSRQSLGDPAVVLSGSLATAWCRVLLWGIPASFLVAGGVGMERAAGWTVPNWLVGLGTISYSLYLVHPFTPQIVAHALRWTGCPSALAADFGMAALSLALGAACWYFVERPLTRAAQGVVARHWRVPIQEVASPLREQNAGVDGRTD